MIDCRGFTTGTLAIMICDFGDVNWAKRNWGQTNSLPSIALRSFECPFEFHNNFAL